MGKEEAHTDTGMFGDAGVTSVAYSPDGSKIVSSGKGGTIKVWDAGAAVSAFSNCHALASDALSDCFSGTLELKASKESAHSLPITSIAFAPDGKTIVSGSSDKTIKVWDAGEPFQLSPCAFSLALTPSRPHLQALSSSRRARRTRTPVT